MHSHPKKVVALFKQHGLGVMPKGGGGEEGDRDKYLRSLPVPAKVKTTLPVLMKPRTPKVVTAALEELKWDS